MGRDNPRYAPTAQTARETASQNEVLSNFVDQAIVSSPPQSDTLTLTNTGTSKRVVEFLSAVGTSGLEEGITVEMRVNDGTPDETTVYGNLPMFPLSFDPGLTWVPGDDVLIRVTNETSASTNVRVALSWRTV